MNKKNKPNKLIISQSFTLCDEHQNQNSNVYYVTVQNDTYHFCPPIKDNGKSSISFQPHQNFKQILALN